MMSLKHRRDASGSASPGPSKSSKVAAECDEAGPSSSSTRSDAEKAAIQSSSLAGFKSLPQEPRTAILEMACYSRFDKGEGVSQLRRDTQMVANLALVSREFNSMFNPLLYRQVSLDRPSKLNSFYQSLLSKPENAQHVESLHLGPMEDLPEEWWPFSPMSRVDDEDYEDETIGPYRKRSHATIKTSLSERDEALGLLPEWVQPKKVFAYQEEHKDCKDGAVLAAIRVALEGIGVDPYDELANATDQIIGIDKWTERLFQAQAVLDLYLCAMRRVEDESSARRCQRLKQKAGKDVASGQCDQYPSVVLEGFEVLEGELRSKEVGASAKDAKGSGEQTQIVITRDQVEAHLARKGAYTDHFDHPLMYARSDLRQLAISYGRNPRVIVDYEREQEEEYYGDDAPSESDNDLDSYDDETDTQDSSSSSHHSLPASPSPGPSSPHRRTRLPSTRSLSMALDPCHPPGLVSIAHAILDMTTEVRNLFLTGYFIHCLHARSPDQDRAAVLDELLCLSIGPLVPSSKAQDCVESVKLAALEELRIVGERISWKTICHFAHQGKKANWPRLKTVQWEFADHWFTLTDTEGLLFSLLNYARGQRTDALGWLKDDDDDEPGKGDAKCPSSTSAAALQLSQPPQRRYIEAKVPPNLVKSMLRKARKVGISEAWKTGSPANDAPHILHLVESRAVNKKPRSDSPDYREDDSEDDEYDSEQDRDEYEYEENFDVLRQESKLWWEAKAEEYSERKRKGRRDEDGDSF